VRLPIEKRRGTLGPAMKSGDSFEFPVKG